MLAASDVSVAVAAFLGAGAALAGSVIRLLKADLGGAAAAAGVALIALAVALGVKV